MSWDLFCKTLVKECAQDFVDYFLPGARFVKMVEGQLQTSVSGTFDPREIRGDLALEVECAHEPVLVNVEWQSSRDREMDERLLSYSCELTRLHKKPVRSAVIYTQPVSDAPETPLVRVIPGARLPGGNLTLWFHFVSLETHEQTVETFRALDLDAFYVLMLLCQDGGTPVVLEEVLERLLKRGSARKEAVAVALFFASKVFKAEDLQFIERKREMAQDTLRESWLYQKVLSEGRMEGRTEGRTEGRMEEARLIIERLVEKRYPALLEWTKGHVAQISSLETLQEALLALFNARTEEEVRLSFPDVR